jgi:hypothetical protein
MVGSVPWQKMGRALLARSRSLFSPSCPLTQCLFLSCLLVDVGEPTGCGGAFAISVDARPTRGNETKRGGFVTWSCSWARDMCKGLVVACFSACRRAGTEGISELGLRDARQQMNGVSRSRLHIIQRDMSQESLSTWPSLTGG